MSASTAFAFIDGLGGAEVLMVAFIALMLFGGKNLPSLARTAGRTIREFKKASNEVQRELRKAIDEAPDTDAPVRSAAPVPQHQGFPSQTPLPMDAGAIDPAYVSSNPSVSYPEGSNSKAELPPVVRDLSPGEGKPLGAVSAPRPPDGVQPAVQHARPRIEPKDL